MALAEITLTKKKVLLALGALLILSAFSGAVFAAWHHNGPQILLGMSQSALAWCF